MADAFRDRVRQLEQELQQATATLNSESCMSMTMMISAAVPVVVFLGLYLAAPSVGFLSEDEGGEQKRSMKKVLMWTTLITAVVWGCIYGYNAYKGSNGTFLCTRQG